MQVPGVQLLGVPQVCHHPLALGICSLGSGSWRCQGSTTAFHSLVCVGVVNRTWDFFFVMCEAFVKLVIDHFCDIL